MSRRQEVHAEIPGQDSFLDVIANLVGVMIILIMVAGMQAKSVFVELLGEKAPTPPAAVESPLVKDLAAAEEAAKAVERGFQDLAARMRREQFEIDYRRAERDRISTLVAAAENTLEAKSNELTAAQKEEYEMFAQLNAAKRQLRDLKLATDATANMPATPGIIEHLPTPMAKTVFGKELHLRLMGGKIAYVPMNEFTDRLKEDAQRNAWKLRDSDRITEVLGPIDGFRMKYTLHRVEKTIPTQGGPARASMVALERFILVPVTDELGEPMNLALTQGSGTLGLLKDFPPDRTTITVWVYPDSFQEFRKFKAEMFKLGYATAGRPLPDGHPIGGSPEGSQSAAQ